MENSGQAGTMSASPTSAVAPPSTKRPLEDPSSPSGPTDQPDAKRPALDKIINESEGSNLQIATDDGAVPIPAAEELKPEVVSTTNDAADVQADTMVADAPNGTFQVPVIDTQPIQSTASTNERGSSHPPSNMPPQDETNWIHVRAVISSAEAATCIGKGGENVSQIRRLSNAKCTVSDYSRGAVERILTVSGQQDAVAKVSLFYVCPRRLC